MIVSLLGFFCVLIFYAIKMVRMLLPIRLMDRLLVALLILIWGCHQGFDDYAIDELRKMVPRSIEGLTFWSNWFVRRKLGLNIAELVLTQVKLNK